jgi:hypothetical protein
MPSDEHPDWADVLDGSADYRDGDVNQQTAFPVGAYITEVK